MRRIRLSIDSTLEHVAMLGMAVNRISLHCMGERQAAYDVELCVVEAVNNAIIHAYQGQSGSEVAVEIIATAEKMIFKIMDSGTAMPDRPVPRELAFDPDDWRTLPEGGMGLFLIHSIMDQVAYTSSASGNVLTMEKGVPPGKDDTAGETP